MPVDLEKYSGLWYEVYRQNAPFEIVCKIPKFGQPSNITALYTLNNNGGIDVVNTCNSIIGLPIQVKGKAYPDPNSTDNKGITLNDYSTNDKLILQLNAYGTMVKSVYEIFYTDYENYSIVGNLNTNYLSFLSRKNVMTEEEFNFLKDVAVFYGFNVLM